MVDPAYPPLGERPESLDGVRVDIPTYKAFPLGSVHVVGFPAEIGFIQFNRNIPIKLLSRILASTSLWE